MRTRLWMGLLVSLLAAVPARAQETRGNINGIVQDQSGVIPGAAVKVTNTDTKQTQQLVTNSRGYFEAVLLNPGNYSVRVELKGFKTHDQTGISLAVGQTVSLTPTVSRRGDRVCRTLAPLDSAATWPFASHRGVGGCVAAYCRS